ncbi:MAG: flavin reductase family protein [Balneolaceae bacterium]
MNLNQQNTAEELKSVMRLLPYPVTIVTTSSGHRKRGATIGSFTSLSMDPPLISFNVTRSTNIHDLLEMAEHFVVHVPGSGQEDLCALFAIPDTREEEQFRELNYSQEAGFPPVLDNVVAEIHCKIVNRIEAGDHTIIIGGIEKIHKNRDEPAILYLDGGYRSVALDK